MKRFLLVLVLLTFVFLPSVPKSEVLEKIDILTGEWKPYTSKDMKGYGLASEIVTRVLERMGYQPNYIFVSFEQAYELTLKSDTNAGVRGTFPFWNMSFIDRNNNFRQRKREMYFSKALTNRQTNNVIFYNPKQDKAKKLKQAKESSDLSGCKLVAVEGYAYPDKVLDLLKENMIKVESEVAAFEKLFDDSEPYIVIAEERVGDQILADKFAEETEKIKIEKVTEELLQFKVDIHFIASRRNPHNQRFINNFNESLGKLRAQGIIDALEKEYFKGPVVRLNAPGTLLIPAGERCDDDFVSRLPRGTRAVVIEWGSELQPDNKDSGCGRFTKVEIMNGPLKGKELFIENKFIELP